ncbi:hypothetical protein LTR37_003866 [Vermiconidia calcicola]|uniref:Uncharacterized protein n=1 Tax=Vermiconidia calcicola TaxID=1690605 RepID=A0ACC3NPH4_9PEZI|nr:hypothetical protein LTR37_003866 [Vermiconidia calcicola]
MSLRSSVQPVGASSEPKGEDATAMQRQSWTPTALRRYTLLSMVLLSATIILAIGALYIVSRLRDGICNAQPNDHYLWTYAPTALFTIVAALWSPVDYRALQMQPWRAMAEGREDVSQTVLLDYVSPWNVKVLYKAIKRRQVIVAAAICVSLILQALIVLSTGLITLNDIERSQSGMTLAAKDRFLLEGSGFDPNQLMAKRISSTLVGAFGQVKGAELSELSAFACFPFAQKVMTTVNFALPAMQIQRPPVVEEDTAGTFNVACLQAVGDPMDALMRQALTDVPSTSDVFDPFVGLLVLGSRGRPAQELSGDANQYRLLDIMNHFYGISVAQLLNTHRIPAASSEQPALEGQLTEPGRYRLVQSAITTHVLVCLLGAILVLTVTTTYIMKTKTVLPKNPCSIAAVASLLVDSKILDMISSVSQRRSDTELLAPFGGYLFSMGWWAGAEGEVSRRRFGIDVGTADNLR